MKKKMAAQKGPADIETSYVGSFYSPLAFIIWTATDHPENSSPKQEPKKIYYWQWKFFHPITR